MATITTAYGQHISLELDQHGTVVVTLDDNDGARLAQIGIESHEWAELLDGIESESD